MTRLLPEGVAAPSGWLAANGYSRQLVRKYVLSGWLTRLGHGVYARIGQPVGGIAALNRQGAAHFLPLGGEQRIQVMSVRKPPTWVRSVHLARVAGTIGRTLPGVEIQYGAGGPRERTRLIVRRGGIGVKLVNIGRMSKAKHAEAVEKMKQVLLE